MIHKINNQKLGFLMVAILSCFLSKAQQMPILNAYHQTNLLYNPASTGSNTETSIFVGVKKQYSNAPFAPVTSFVTFDHSLTQNKLGLGFVAMSDRTQFTTNNTAMATLAYHAQLSNNKIHYFSGGFGLGIVNQRFDFSKAVVADASDPILLNDNSSATVFDMNVGILYRYEGLKMGFSVPQILNNTVRYKNNKLNETASNYKLARHYMASLGYTIKINKNEFNTITPSIIMRKVDGMPTQYDGSLNYNYFNKFWIGGGYRSGIKLTEAASYHASAGLAVNNKLNVTYYYEQLSNSGAKTAFGNAHEIVVGFKINKKNTTAITTTTTELPTTTTSTDYNNYINNQQQAISKTQEELKALNEKINNGIVQNVEDGKNGAIAKANVIYKKLGSIYFNLNSADLTEETKANLNTITNALINLKSNAFVYLAGNASQEGNDVANLILSTKRANAVKKYVEEKGIKLPILLLSYGENSPITTQQIDEEDKNKNRRVDIFISRQ
ncbi:MAG: PorP/SprF family type IX secretion system membrane protein [Ferruginibacter sp.]|nr:PorP/SprF family type IX secretion system membrane protein [Ferruginibacter sp.]